MRYKRTVSLNFSQPPKRDARPHTRLSFSPSGRLHPKLGGWEKSRLRCQRHLPHSRSRLIPSSGHAIEARKRAKNRAHFDHCRSQGIFFQPLVVETFGGWCADALTFLKELGRQDARRWGKDPALEIKYFFQRLSVALQRGNAALIIDRDVEPTS